MHRANPWRHRQHFLLLPNEDQFFFFNSLLQQCLTLKQLKILHTAMFKSQLHENLYLLTKLISNYTMLGSMNYAFNLFSLAQTSDVFLWNVLIRGYAEQGFQSRAISMYSQMREIGIDPDNFTFPFVLKACSVLQDLDHGKRFHRDAVQFGYDYDVFVCNSLIVMYGRCGCLEAARQLFDEMPQRSVVSWSAVIGACVQNGFFEDGLGLFRRMGLECIRPNRATILNVIRAVCGLVPSSDLVDEIYGAVVENGLDADICVRNAAMGMFAKCGKIEIARELFEGTRDRDLISWSSMMEAYAEADMPVEALDLFKQMRLRRITPDYVTMLSLIRVCSNLASLVQARMVHGFIIRCLFERELIVETSLIDLFVKCGSLEVARKLFDKMPERSIVAWSTMISGYGMHGLGKNALELFNQMKSLMKLDHVAFVSILSACSHSGLITDGWQCFDSMTRDFGLAPRPEHYACMVDLMGRAGKLEDAMEFIENMPVEPDAGVWGALLGACRIHSNVRLAKLAAKSLFELDPKNSGRYVLLANIYAASGSHEEAAKVRALMRKRGVKKNAAHTVVEVKNTMVKFLVGDRSHPESHMIYRELEKLIQWIKEEGYAPETNFVLHDVEEEMKVTMLTVHSEKLAIVFGLMNSRPESLIRITKNLRVCGDCHTATKFISKATGREIMMRDAYRFHHFHGGACSCGDYW